MRCVVVALVSVALGLSSCAGPRTLGGSPSITIVDAAEMPAPNGEPSGESAAVYRIGGRDRLLVDVYGIEQLQDRQFETDISGRIALPLVGPLEAGGLTLSELEALISRRLEQAFVRDPQVSVNPIELRSQQITVEGSVREPGIFPVTNQMTLMRAVALARGTSEFAKLDDVVVFREVRGQKMVALYNLGAIRRGAYEDPRIYPDDIIVVGESSGRRLFGNIVQAGALITAPLIALVNQS